ncbi:hypothetical protein HY992_05145 [Candidatus Micrarchaeota archaeon]|nr:hypothetical protein [Candidatus Micrarchaeota archaeon]
MNGGKTVEKKSGGEGFGRGSNRAGFAKLSPLADRLEEKARLLVIGEFGGGTKAFSKDNVVGACALLREMRKRGEKVDVLVINGGLVPEVPTRISRRNQDKMKFLADGINALEDAVCLVKPHVKRLVKAAGEGVRVVYVLGDEDGENLKILKDTKIAQLKTAANIQKKVEECDAKVASISARVDAVNESLEGVRVQFKELGKGRKKGVEAGRKSFSERHERLSKQAKELGKMSEKLQRALKKANEEKARLEGELGDLRVRRFTNQEEFLPNENKEIDAMVWEEYKGVLEKVFGSACDVEIVEGNVRVLEVNGLRVALGHNITNTSKVAKKTALHEMTATMAKDELSGLVEPSDVLVFSHSPGTKCRFVAQTFGDAEPKVLLQQGGFMDAGALHACWNAKIKVPQTEALKHTVDSGATLVTVNEDGSYTFELVGAGQLFREAQAIMNEERGKLEARLKKTDLRTQKGAAGETSARGKDSGKSTAGGKPDASFEKLMEEGSELELAAIRSKLPSELNDDELRTLVEATMKDVRKINAGKVAEELVRVAPVGEEKKLLFEFVGDTQVGVGNPLDQSSNYERIDAYVKDSQEKGIPDVLVFMGDMAEGSLGGKLNEYIPKAFKSIDEMRRKIDGLDVSAGEKAELMNEFLLRLNYANSIHNVDEQFEKMRPLIMHAVRVLQKGGDVVLISGNHYNQTQRQENFDEATRMAYEIRLASGIEQNDPHIHVLSGGWYGGGDAVVQGVPMFGVHKGRFSPDKVTGLMEHKIGQMKDVFLVAQGHHHDLAFGKDVTGVYLTTLSIAPMIGFVDQVGLRAGVQGYTRMELKLDENGKPCDWAKITNVTIKQLEKHMKPIPELYRELVKGDT